MLRGVMKAQQHNGRRWRGANAYISGEENGGIAARQRHARRARRRGVTLPYVCPQRKPWW